MVTRLSNLLATMEANRCSPASSDIKKTYSGAVTWFDLWVLPVNKWQVCSLSLAIRLKLAPWRVQKESSCLHIIIFIAVTTDRTAVWLCQHSKAALVSCALFFSGSLLGGQLARKYLSWQLLRWWQCSVWWSNICRWWTEWKTDTSTSRKSPLPSLRPWTSASLWGWGFLPARRVLSGIHRWCFRRHYSPRDLYGRSSAMQLKIKEIITRLEHDSDSK